MNLSLFRIYPASGYAHKVVDVLESMKVALASMPDCLGCTIAFETEDDGAIVYAERWNSHDALQAHLRSSLFGRVLEAMEYSRKQPEVDFFTVSCLGGMEIIREARLVPQDALQA